MRKGWIVGIIALVIVAVAAGGGYYLFFQDKVQVNVEQAVQRFFANPPAPYTKATYGKLDVSLASRRLTIDDIVLERSTPPYAIKIGRFEATGIDVDNLQTVFDPAKYKDGSADQTFRKLADTLTLTKVDGDMREDGRLTIDQFVAKGIQGHQFNVKPDPAVIASLPERERSLMFIDAIRFDSASIDNFDRSGSKTAIGKVRRFDVTDFSRQGIGMLKVGELDLVDPRDNTRTAWKSFELRDIPGDPWFDYMLTGKPPADVMRLINLGGVKIEDLRVQPGKPGQPAVRLASFDLGKVDRKRLERVDIKGFEVIEGGGGVTVGTVEIRKIEWEQLLGLVGQKDWFSKLSSINYSIEKFSVRDIGGPSLDEIGAKLKEFAFKGYVDYNDKTESTIVIDSFQIDATKIKDPQFAGMLKLLGYEKPVLSLEVVGSGNFKTNVQSLDKLRLYGPEIGDFSLSFVMSDYKQPQVANRTPSMQDALAPLMAARLNELKISWKDDSLTNRILKAAAASQGTTEDQLRAQIIAQVQGLAQAYKDDAKVTAAFQAVVDYLTKPGSLRVVAKPPSPPRFGELGPVFANSQGGPPNLPEIFRVLGVTVTAN